VCWGVKRALLSQGYMLDRPNESGVLTGTRDFQPEPKLNVSYHLQATCADNRDSTSIVFVTATREDSRLQKMKQSTSVGVGPATLTMPSGSAQVLGVVRRDTVGDPAFYERFFTLASTHLYAGKYAGRGCCAGGKRCTGCPHDAPVRQPAGSHTDRDGKQCGGREQEAALHAARAPGVVALDLVIPWATGLPESHGSVQARRPASHRLIERS
jgi:hypothetical protein